MGRLKFKATLRDAKVTSDKVIINLLGGDGLSVDELRMYFGELVNITVETVQPPLPIMATEGYVINAETGEVY